MSAASTQYSVAFSATTSEEAFSGQWVLDSGASRHITIDKQHLQHYRSLDPETATVVTFGNNHQVKAVGCGDLIIKTQAQKSIVLRKVLYVPEASANLFSIKTATEAGAQVIFEGDSCYIHKDAKLWLEGCKHGDVFVIDEATAVEHAMAATSKGAAELWHRRFGHLGYDNLIKLKDMVDGISVTGAQLKLQQQLVCEPCVAAKQHRDPFPLSRQTSKRTLELVHMDLCGPLQVPSRGGAKYIATFLDDYSKLSYVKVIPQKSDVAQVVQQVLQMLEIQTGNKLQTVRTDRGREYLNASTDAFFKAEGVTHQTTAPYTPQQNGSAERINRTLMDRIRAMLEDAKLEDNMWAEAVMTANYIRNRSPTSQNAKTPWELFFGRKPNVSGMKVFGATAYVHVPQSLRKKLDSHSQKGIFVGYEANSKAYRVLLNSGKISISMDVIFDEDIKHEGTTVISRHIPIQDSDSDEPAVEMESAAAAVKEEVAEAAAEVVAAKEAAEEEDQEAAAAATEQRRSQRQDKRVPLRFRDSVHATIAQASPSEEPQTYEEAMQSSDAQQWSQAMNEEMASLQAHGTWVLTEQPQGVKPIPVRWIFKKKLDAQGNIERYKARLVAKGFMQREGVDFNEVFAPVSKHTTLRTLLGMVASQDLELHQLDIKTAFLNAELEETIYMQQPRDYEEGSANTACLLKKSLYGLRQAPRAWHTRLKQELEHMGFTASEADPGLYILHHKNTSIYLLVYVDDMLIAAKDQEAIEYIKERLTAAFEVRDLSQVLLGNELGRDRQQQTLEVTQERLSTELVHRYGLSEGKTKSVPMSPAIKLTQVEDGAILDKEKFQYCELVGSLLNLSVCTRPDIAQSVGVLARYMAKPAMEHWTAAKAVLRYISGTLGFGITFANSGTMVEGYCDADYAGDLDTRRSTTGFIFTFCGAAISWSSKLQPTVAASTTEAEYMAAAQAVKEALWLRKLAAELEVQFGTMKIFSDNQGAIKLLKHPVASIRSKHIDVIHHFARERVARKEVHFEYISTELMVADCMT